MRQANTSSNFNLVSMGIYLCIAFLFINTFQCNGQEICLQATTEVEFTDVGYTSKEDFYEETISSEKFIKEVNSFSNSLTVGYGPTVGFMGIEVGVNLDVTYAWSKSTDSEIKQNDFNKVTKSQKIEFQPDTRQLYRKITTTSKIFRKGRPEQREQAKHTIEKHVGVVSPDVCKSSDLNQLEELAKKHIQREANKMRDSNFEVEIISGGTALSTTICGRQGIYHGQSCYFAIV